MPRSTNAVARKAKKKRIFDISKGYRGRGKNVWTVSKNLVEKGLQYAYIHRKQKKRTFRSLWIIRINAALRMNGYTYSPFIHRLKEKKIDLNRKVLADLAAHHPNTFTSLINKLKS